MKSTAVGVFLWLFASVVWGQNAGQGPQELLGQRSGGPVLALPAVPGSRPVQVAQRLRRFDAQLCALRNIMDEVYRLFDRRCRSATALAKRDRLRHLVRRYRSLGKSLD